MLFFATTASSGSELWESDGTEQGTVIVAEITNGSGSGAVPNSFLEISDHLAFFAGTDESAGTGEELYVYDGLSIELVKDINSGPASTYITNTMPGCGGLFFQANDGISGDELWFSDGTEQGTYSLGDVDPGPTGNAVPLIELDDHLIFLATAPGTGTELWVYDCVTTSVDERSANDPMRIFPTMTHDHFAIDLPSTGAEWDVIVHDTNGKIVSTSNGVRQSYTVDVRNWNCGSYQVVAQSGRTRSVGRVIIAR